LEDLHPYNLAIQAEGSFIFVQGKYEKFKEVIERSPEKDPGTSNSPDHPAVIEVMILYVRCWQFSSFQVFDS
jgi:hypothetical protein